MKQVKGGVTAAKGFCAASTAAGIKYQNRQDMAMIYSEVPCAVAGTFTTNLVKAAPVKWDQKIVYETKKAQAVVINAGIANACTGEEGMRYCRQTAEKVGELLPVPKDQVLVASTGVIGMQLPMERICAGIEAMVPALSGGTESGHAAAQAIMTTDTHEKEIAVEVMLGGVPVTIGGMCKGSGMIHPNMCTMLSFVTTDAAITQPLLLEALQADVCDTYNMISVDGDTSTNDTCLLLANGMAENPVISEKNEDYDKFCEALRTVNEYLAKQMAGDGEGATKLLICKTTGAKDWETAKTVAKSVICSSLLKAAMFGEDANWGRVLCAIGYAGADIDINKVDVSFKSAYGQVDVCVNGAGINFSEEEAAKVLHEKEITILVELNSGDAEAEAFGCDLTYDYVKINGDYRT